MFYNYYSYHQVKTPIDFFFDIDGIWFYILYLMINDFTTWTNSNPLFSLDYWSHCILALVKHLNIFSHFMIIEFQIYC